MTPKPSLQQRWQALQTRFAGRLGAWQDNRRLAQLTGQIVQHAGEPSPTQPTVVVFNATARISGLSQTAAFGLLAGWSLRLAGARVHHFVCNSGMTRCVLGTDRDDFHKTPPCQACLRQSQRLYAGAEATWFAYRLDPALEAALQALDLPALSQFEYPISLAAVKQKGEAEERCFVPTIPLGRLVLPALRWALRRHSLPDDEDTRFLLRQYILSAYNVAQQFSACLDNLTGEGDPSQDASEAGRPEWVAPTPVVLIFNGIMFPEATARWVAQQRGLRVVTYEVSFQPLSAFFSDGQATAYPITIPDDFEPNEAQNALLDEYLEKRFQGRFSMAGIRFWPEMRRLDQALLDKIASFDQLAAVFSNVVYDTSQVHANVLFSNMFEWLEQILEIVRTHPRTLFVIRAHPDEIRPGTRKSSRETVEAWVQSSGAGQLPNLAFIGPQEYLSSYELIERSKFVMVYNSSIGLEATLLGAPVLCAGKARYTQYPMVFFPASQAEHRQQAEQFLAAEQISVPPEFARNARRFLYYQLYRASLSFQDFLVPERSPALRGSGAPADLRPEYRRRQGYVRLQDFNWHALLPENHPSLERVVNGLLRPAEPLTGLFLLPDQAASPTQPPGGERPGKASDDDDSAHR